MFVRLLMYGAALVVAYYLLRAIALYAVDQGWIYGRGQAPKRGNVVGGLGFEQVFEPEIEYLIEEVHRTETEADHEAPGADPNVWFVPDLDGDDP